MELLTIDVIVVVVVVGGGGGFGGGGGGGGGGDVFSVVDLSFLVAFIVIILCVSVISIIYMLLLLQDVHPIDISNLPQLVEYLVHGQLLINRITLH